MSKPDQKKINELKTKLKNYYQTVNEDSIVHNSIKINEINKLLSVVEPKIIPLFSNKTFDINDQIVLLHIISKLEYENKSTRANCPYSIEELKALYLSALNADHEPMHFQALKCYEIAESLARHTEGFGDQFHPYLTSALNHESSRVRLTALYLLCIKSPDQQEREFNNLNALQKIIEQGGENETYQAIQFLRGRSEIYKELIPALENKLNNYNGKNVLYLINVYTRYLDELRTMKFYERCVELKTLHSLQTILNLIELNIYDWTLSRSKTMFDHWFETYPSLQTQLLEMSAKFNFKLKAIEETNFDDMPENLFLALVSKKRVEGTLVRILKIFDQYRYMIFRGDGGMDIMASIYFYTAKELNENYKTAGISSQVLAEAKTYCRE